MVNKLYENKEWLQKKYEKEELDSTALGNLCGVNSLTIRNWLRKLGISVRSSAYSQHLNRTNHCDLSEEATDFLTGELLGDGSLQKGNFSSRFTYGSKYEEYLVYLSQKLDSFGIKQSGKFVPQIRKEWNNCKVYHYTSILYKELKDWRNVWYPDGKKIIPKYVKLDPLVCRQFFIGDGSLLHSYDSRPSIVFCTESFSTEDTDILLNKFLALNFQTTKQKNNRIHISVHSTKDFLDYIGPCPKGAEVYLYKWDYECKLGRIRLSKRT